MGFTRNKEDFTCEHCGTKVQGTGYTNHCPQCLWSKHVDIEPGDRAHDCGGMMEPIRVEGTAGKFRIVHKCTKCFKEHRNNTTLDDSQDALIEIASHSAN